MANAKLTNGMYLTVGTLSHKEKLGRESKSVILLSTYFIDAPIAEIKLQCLLDHTFRRLVQRLNSAENVTTLIYNCTN